MHGRHVQICMLICKLIHISLSINQSTIIGKSESCLDVSLSADNWRQPHHRVSFVEGDTDKEVWSHHTSAASTSLASGVSANHLPSWLWSPSSAFVVWRHPTWLTRASPFRRSSADGSCGRLTAGHSSCHVPGLRSVGETLLCQARRHGTALPSNCGLHHCLLRRLRKNSKLIYSAASASEDFCLTGAI